MFEGLLPEGLNIYATTASNPAENSFATYCPYDYPDVQFYGTCLGDVYSVSWMEDRYGHTYPFFLRSLFCMRRKHGFLKGKKSFSFSNIFGWEGV